MILQRGELINEASDWTAANREDKVATVDSSRLPSIVSRSQLRGNASVLHFLVLVPVDLVQYHKQRCRGVCGGLSCHACLHSLMHKSYVRSSSSNASPQAALRSKHLHITEGVRWSPFFESGFNAVSATEARKHRCAKLMACITFDANSNARHVVVNP